MNRQDHQRDDQHGLHQQPAKSRDSALKFIRSCLMGQLLDNSAKYCFPAGAHRQHLGHATFDTGPHEHHIGALAKGCVSADMADALGNGKGLASQRRLIDVELLIGEHHAICGYTAAGFKQHHIAWHHPMGRDPTRSMVSQHHRHDHGAPCQTLKGTACDELLRKSKRGAHQHNAQDHNRLNPVRQQH